MRLSEGDVVCGVAAATARAAVRGVEEAQWCSAGALARRLGVDTAACRSLLEALEAGGFWTSRTAADTRECKPPVPNSGAVPQAVERPLSVPGRDRTPGMPGSRPATTLLRCPGSYRAPQQPDGIAQAEVVKGDVLRTPRVYTIIRLSAQPDQSRKKHHASAMCDVTGTSASLPSSARNPGGHGDSAGRGRQFCSAVGRVLDDPAPRSPEDPAVRSGAVPPDVSAQQCHQVGRDGDGPCLAGGAVLEAAFLPGGPRGRSRLCPRGRQRRPGRSCPTPSSAGAGHSRGA